MPLVQVKLIEGVFNADEKESIIEKPTDAMVSVEGEAILPGTRSVTTAPADTAPSPTQAADPDAATPRTPTRSVR
jgi:hypothetical protein